MHIFQKEKIKKFILKKDGDKEIIEIKIME